jgi:Tol biopolymer transport system component
MSCSEELDGREPGLVRLTTDARFKRDPVFWPGGRELIYAELTPDVPSGMIGCPRLMRMQWRDRASATFLPHGKELCVSADGSVFAYCLVEYASAGGESTIVVEERQRQRKVTLRRGPGTNNNNLSRPALSPDGSRLVCERGHTRIVALDLLREGGQDVELGVEGDRQPSFSPDGRRIVFTSRRDRDFEIYVMNADGSEQRRLTRSRGIDMNPVFSPDGRRIAFTSNRDGNYEIYVMDADGRNQRRVTRSSERSDFACWHPDGKHLVFVGERSGRFDLCMVDVPA